MRDILFRGKERFNGQWLYGNLVKYHNGEFAVQSMDKDHNVAVPVIADTIGQYTGLTDRNGTKIFEGDIVRLCRATHQIIVFWDGLGWKFKRADGKLVKGAFESDIMHDIEICEVIGNIYDNPELLKEQEQ